MFDAFTKTYAYIFFNGLEYIHEYGINSCPYFQKKFLRRRKNQRHCSDCKHWKIIRRDK